MFEINIRAKLGAFSLDVQFSTERKILVLLGPSGSGKTLTLKHIAGFMAADEGFIKSGDRVLFSKKDRINIKPEKRHIGYVLQEPYLFPHLTIKKNLIYSGADNGSLEFEKVADLLDLGPLLNRMPGSLSGGEKQRAAIGRTLLSYPQILLMDEPLSSVDSKAKWKILDYIRQINLQLNMPIIYVTHSFEETEYVSDEIGLMSRGKLIAYGPKTTILHSTEFFKYGFKNSYTNFYKAKILSRVSGEGTYRISIADKTFQIVSEKEIANHSVYVSIAAHNIVIMNERPGHISTRNIQEGIITDIISAGESYILVINSGFELYAEVTKSAVNELDLQANKKIYYLIKASAFKIYE